MLEQFGIWIAAICTLAIYSLLYKENVIYRLFEHAFIGLSAGLSIGVLISETMYRYWWTPMTEGAWLWAFAVPFGLLLYFIYSAKYEWMSRVVFGFLIGVQAGLFFQVFASLYMPQLYTSFLPLKPSYVGGWVGTINNTIFIVTLLTVLSYFLFSFEQEKPAVRHLSLLGRWALMVALGAIFGNTVMARMALLVGRLDFLYGDWLKLLR